LKKTGFQKKTGTIPHLRNIDKMKINQGIDIEIKSQKVVDNTK
tara:strand:+ start:30 stop:158 length:129 start_codon:yes stop_codon:yes gene_type:complete